jgi:hypothetical protein
MLIDEQKLTTETYLYTFSEMVSTKGDKFLYQGLYKLVS